MKKIVIMIAVIVLLFFYVPCSASEMTIEEMVYLSGQKLERVYELVNEPKFTGIFSNYISFSEYEGSF